MSTPDDDRTNKHFGKRENFSTLVGQSLFPWKEIHNIIPDKGIVQLDPSFKSKSKAWTKAEL